MVEVSGGVSAEGCVEVNVCVWRGGRRDDERLLVLLQAAQLRKEKGWTRHSKTSL